MDCIDLRERFGGRYKVRDESWTWGGREAFPRDPWHQVILCQNGHVAPWGGTRLVACTLRSGPVAERLRRMPCCRVEQDGDDGVNASFDVRDFDRVAEVMKPRRRRRMSEELKAAAAERFRAMRESVGFTPT